MEQSEASLKQGLLTLKPMLHPVSKAIVAAARLVALAEMYSTCLHVRNFFPLSLFLILFSLLDSGMYLECLRTCRKKNKASCDSWSSSGTGSLDKFQLQNRGEEKLGRERTFSRVQAETGKNNLAANKAASLL